MIPFEEIQRLDQEAIETIDTSWHLSKYWERGEWGALTDEGWKQVYSDCQSRIDNCEQQLSRLLKLRDRLDDLFAEKKANT